MFSIDVLKIPLTIIVSQSFQLSCVVGFHVGDFISVVRIAGFSIIRFNVYYALCGGLPITIVFCSGLFCSGVLYIPGFFGRIFYGEHYI